MKILIKNITVLLIVLFLTNCEEPAPIELLTDEDPETEIEIINNQLSSVVITGYDSTGIINEPITDASIVSFSGVKNTFNNITFYKGYGEAIFFDKSNPIINSFNNIIGYKTLEFGQVKFGDDVAKIVPFRIKFRDLTGFRDTLLGVKHVLDYRSVLIPSVLNFPYNKTIQIEFKNNFGSSQILHMKIPKEIVGKVRVFGTVEARDIRLEISWNKSDLGTEEIIIGAVDRITKDLFPLFRVKDPYRDKILISNDLISQIPFNNYSHLVFSFIRKIRHRPNSSDVGELYFASNSIHNIWIEIK